MDVCKDCGHYTFRPFSCNDALCEVCERNRLARIKKRYLMVIKSLKFPKLITLTVGSLPIVHPDVIRHHKRQAYQLLRWFKREYGVTDAFMVYEFQGDWNLHFHIIANTPKYIMQSKISERWFKLSGRFRVDIRRCTPHTAMEYVIKYLVKVPEFESTHRYIEYALARHGTRILGTYGSLFGVKLAQKISHLKFCESCNRETIHFFGSMWCYSEQSFILDYFGSMDKVP
jgi:hypothetical protein